VNNIQSSEIKKGEYPSLESQATDKNTQIVVWNGKNCSVLDPIQRDNPHRIILTEAGQKLLSLTDPRETTFIYFPIAIKEEKLAIKEEKFQLLQLPVEMQANIHSFLDYKSILALRQTSRDNFTLINNCSLFRNKDCNENARKYLRNTLMISQEKLDEMGKTGDLIKITKKILVFFIFLFPNLKKITFHDKIMTRNENHISSPIKTISFLSNKICVNKIKFKYVGVSDSIPEDIILPLQFFPNASKLRIISTDIYPDYASNLIKKLPNLKKIDLSGLISSGQDSQNEEIKDYDDTFIYSLVSNSPNVETLILNGAEDTEWTNIDNVSSITDLYDNFPQCQFLKNLHLQKTKVNDGHLLKIANACPSLEYIDLRECPEITDTGIEDFRFYFGILYPDQKPVRIDK